MTNDERMTKHEWRKIFAVVLVMRSSESSFVIRHSGFVIFYSLANLPRAHLGFPGENARAFGKRRCILRSGAFAGKRDKAHRARVRWPHKTDTVIPQAHRAYRASNCGETAR